MSKKKRPLTSTELSMVDRTKPWGIAANIDTEDSAFRLHARVLVQGWHGDYSSARVSGVSKGGRRIVTYVQFKRLARFRACFIPESVDEHFARFENHGYIVARYEKKELAQAMATSLERDWSIVRRGTRGQSDGPITREGISENAMCKMTQEEREKLHGE